MFGIVFGRFYHENKLVIHEDEGVESLQMYRNLTV